MIDYTPIVGKKFNHLTVVSVCREKRKRTKLRCRCDCGSFALVYPCYVKSGKTKTCGCSLIKRGNYRHGMTGTPTHRSWTSMRDRCTNENSRAYMYYGGRGIKICMRWDSFESFFEDMGEKPNRSYTIERVDVNGDYEPANCKWVKKSDQSKNRRKPVNFLDVTKCPTCMSPFKRKVASQVFCQRSCVRKT